MENYKTEVYYDSKSVDTFVATSLLCRAYEKTSETPANWTCISSKFEYDGENRTVLIEIIKYVEDDGGLLDKFILDKVICVQRKILSNGICITAMKPNSTLDETNYDESISAVVYNILPKPFRINAEVPLIIRIVMAVHAYNAGLTFSRINSNYTAIYKKLEKLILSEKINPYDKEFYELFETNDEDALDKLIEFITKRIEFNVDLNITDQRENYNVTVPNFTIAARLSSEYFTGIPENSKSVGIIEVGMLDRTIEFTWNSKFNHYKEIFDRVVERNGDEIFTPIMGLVSALIEANPNGYQKRISVDPSLIHSIVGSLHDPNGYRYSTSIIGVFCIIGVQLITSPNSDKMLYSIKFENNSDFLGMKQKCDDIMQKIVKADITEPTPDVKEKDYRDFVFTKVNLKFGQIEYTPAYTTKAKNIIPVLYVEIGDAPIDDIRGSCLSYAKRHYPECYAIIFAQQTTIDGMTGNYCIPMFRHIIVTLKGNLEKVNVVSGNAPKEEILSYFRNWCCFSSDEMIIERNTTCPLMVKYTTMRYDTFCIEQVSTTDTNKDFEYLSVNIIDEFANLDGSYTINIQFEKKEKI